MRDQYAGDISDLLKIALLRHLAGSDLKLGVHWYYNTSEKDREEDGRHLEYRREEKWRTLDDELWQSLCKLNEQKVAALEQLQIWPQGTVFFREPIPGNVERSNWADRAKQALNDAAILFLDPDNGLGRRGKKHATLEELQGLNQPNRTLVVIKFPARRDYQEQLSEYHARILESDGFFSALTMQISVHIKTKSRIGRSITVPRIRWFTIINASSEIQQKAKAFSQKIAKIEGCRAEISTVQRGDFHMVKPGKPEPANTDRRANKVCPVPECDHIFTGKGWGGIDGHWKSNHLSVMSYEDAWPLIKSGKYPRQTDKELRIETQARTIE